MHPLPLIDGALFVDNSMLELLTTCPRALEYNKLFARVAANEKPSLNFGSAIHLALEYRYQVYQNRPVDQQYFEDVTTLLTEFFDAHPCPIDDFRNLNWAMEVVKQYCNRYPQEDFRLLTYDQPQTCSHCLGQDISTIIPVRPCLWCKGTGKLSTMVELPFALHLFDWEGILDDGSNAGDSKYKTKVPVYYSGRIDLPNHREGDHLWVDDHKTTSVLGPQFFDKMKMSGQQKGYAWSFEQLTGQKVTGYCVNAIRTKEPPIYVTSDEVSKYGKKSSPKQWWEESLQRERFYIKPGELDEWRNNAINLVEEFFWRYQRGYFPMYTPNACCLYGRCQYFDVCSMQSSDRGTMLASGLFQDNTWNPLRVPSQSKQ